MQITPGRLVYEEGQKWLRANASDVPLTDWGHVRAKEQQYWEAMGQAFQTALAGQKWDGFYCGLTLGFLSAALVFIIARG